ncbi:MAG: type II toxin-antitoxin system RelE/ParE family toxin [Actinomycetota bacterium]|nr:type II toxin-antitoxin system RelE/ParE family toxin [Actinomycetota bacterium]
MRRVVYLPEAEQERGKLPGTERAALYNAVRKLEAIGPSLPYPHSSDVRGVQGLRELRLRAGRSAWRALYRQAGDVFVIAAVGPEAQHDPRGFSRACEQALRRLAELDEEG